MEESRNFKELFFAMTVKLLIVGFYFVITAYWIFQFFLHYVASFLVSICKMCSLFVIHSWLIIQEREDFIADKRCKRNRMTSRIPAVEMGPSNCDQTRQIFENNAILTSHDDCNQHESLRLADEEKYNAKIFRPDWTKFTIKRNDFENGANAQASPDNHPVLYLKKNKGIVPNAVFERQKAIDHNLNCLMHFEIEKFQRETEVNGKCSRKNNSNCKLGLFSSHDVLEKIGRKPQMKNEYILFVEGKFGNNVSEKFQIMDISEKLQNFQVIFVDDLRYNLPDMSNMTSEKRCDGVNHKRKCSGKLKDTFVRVNNSFYPKTSCYSNTIIPKKGQEVDSEARHDTFKAYGRVLSAEKLKINIKPNKITVSSTLINPFEGKSYVQKNEMVFNSENQYNISNFEFFEAEEEMNSIESNDGIRLLDCNKKNKFCKIKRNYSLSTLKHNIQKKTRHIRSFLKTGPSYKIRVNKLYSSVAGSTSSSEKEKSQERSAIWRFNSSKPFYKKLEN